MSDLLNEIPDARDGLTRLERAVLYILHQMERERPGRPVPTLELYGRVVEIVDCSQAELQAVLNRMVDRPISGDPGL
ncbi:MAG: hypothetical protein AAGE01_01625 [Pseudomonadota bacterium]